MPMPAWDNGSASIRSDPGPLSRREKRMTEKSLGAAAEVRDEHRLVTLQLAGVPIGRPERLVGQHDVRHAGL